MNRERRRKIDLFWLLTKKELTLKYKRTTIGIFWSLLHPFLTTVVLFIAFKVFMRFEMENYIFFLLCALFPWNWFYTTVIMSTQALTNNVNLIKTTRFPIHFLIMATVFAQLINFLLALLIIVGLSYIYGKGIGINYFLGIPILIVIQLIVLTGASLAISIVNVYFRDLEHIASVFLTMLFWLTPIIYPLELVPETYRIYVSINPLTHLVTAWRDLFMLGFINWNSVLVSFGSSVIFLLFGIIVFKKLKKNLYEIL